MLKKLKGMAKVLFILKFCFSSLLRFPACGHYLSLQNFDFSGICCCIAKRPLSFVNLKMKFVFTFSTFASSKKRRSRKKPVVWGLVSSHWCCFPPLSFLPFSTDAYFTVCPFNFESKNENELTFHPVRTKSRGTTTTHTQCCQWISPPCHILKIFFFFKNFKRGECKFYFTPCSKNKSIQFLFYFVPQMSFLLLFIAPKQVNVFL